ncbi:MAG: methionyl-tRNA formyltransferase [Eubacteriales bacterium]|nr:methionyl-tRNA formyltransferase [Eubacteriales bacterium]
MKNKRIVFMGTPEYALESLKALVKEGLNVVGVFTQPDRPKNRGKKIVKSPVKLFAEENNIPVFQPRRIKAKDGVEALKELKPDVCVSAAFGQILSQEILDIPPYGTVNVHASLLPKYRGSAPINWCIINGEKTTGVTTMLTDAGIDTGDILLKKETEIKSGETAGELTQRLAILGAELLIETLKALFGGKLKPQKQDESQASYYPMLKKEMGDLDFNMPASKIEGLVLGLNPWPGAFVKTPKGILKIHRAKAVKDSGNKEAGTVILASPKQGLTIKTGDGAIEITELQAPNKKAMDACAYLRGNPMNEGESILKESAYERQ